MTLIGWMQILLFCAIVVALVKPLGGYMTRVFDGERTFLSPVLGPVERGSTGVGGVDETREQHWTTYAVAMLLFNLAGFLLLYALLRLQGVLPLNPAGMSAVAPDLAFNTAVSFVTNTNWQNYGGETHDVLSHPDGRPDGAELRLRRDRHRAGRRPDPRLRPRVRQRHRQFLGRPHALHALRPAADLRDLRACSWSGRACRRPSAPMSTRPRSKAASRPSPVARSPRRSPSRCSAPMAAASSTPTPRIPSRTRRRLSNFVQMLSIFAIGAALTNVFGRMVGDERQGWAILAAMGVLFIAGVAVAVLGRGARQRCLHRARASTGGNMEGKEVRFGIAASALFAVITTAASCGAVNAMHDSFTPLGGMIPLINMELGEIIVGGVGAGLYGMLLFAIIAMFVAGLMVGRTPEYLGKKIEAREVKMAMLAILFLPLMISASPRLPW